MNMKKMLAVVAAASLVAVAAPAFANPFSDVPLNHWAYDAVETLAAKGILEGYPDDTFRGQKAMTRYEIATMVARMMANENVGGEDIEQLKALVVEFGPELEAMGVKVDGFDSRLAALEKGLSGWKISGEMRFDYADYDNDTYDTGNNRTGFTTSRARILLHRDLDNGVSFDARWHDDRIDRYWVTARDFFGIKGLTAKLGSFLIVYMNQDGFRAEQIESGVYDDVFMDDTYRGAELSYSNGRLTLDAFAANAKGKGDQGVYDANDSSEFYGARIRYDFSEKLFLSANLYYQATDGNTRTLEDKSTKDSDNKYLSYWFALGIKPVPGIQLSAFYIAQDIDLLDSYESGFVDDPDAYRITLNISQDILKFTSLGIEYTEYGEGFIADVSSHYFDTTKTSPKYYYDVDSITGQLKSDHTEFYVAAKQQWTPKFSTFLAYQYIEADEVEAGTDDESNIYTIGIGYQYSPALYFQLAYHDQDGLPGKADYENQMIRFRTHFFF